MPDTPSITINKVMNYRGDLSEEFSNTYHFSGTTPANDAAWKALAEAIWQAERPMLDNVTKYVGYLGYEAGNEHAVSLWDPRDEALTPQGGTLALEAGNTRAPGDAALWVRWLTPKRTSKGKKVYCRNYFHPVYFNQGVDTLLASQKTAALAFGAKMIDGTLPGGAKKCGPQGEVCSLPFVSPFVTTRTLKRRGKRPSS